MLSAIYLYESILKLLLHPALGSPLISCVSFFLSYCSTSHCVYYFLYQCFRWSIYLSHVSGYIAQSLHWTSHSSIIITCPYQINCLVSSRLADISTLDVYLPMLPFRIWSTHNILHSFRTKSFSTVSIFLLFLFVNCLYAIMMSFLFLN